MRSIVQGFVTLQCSEIAETLHMVAHYSGDDDLSSAGNTIR
jgi:hypothetical protein